MTTEPVAADLNRYIAVLRRGYWGIGLVTVLVVIVAFVWASNQSPVYTASAEVLVEEIGTSTPFVESGPLILENEARIATSSRVVSAVRRALAENGEEPAPTMVETPVGASTLVFISESSDPRTAQITADAYASTYLSERRELIVGDVVAARGDLEARIEELTIEIAAKRRALLEADTPNEIDVLGVELDMLNTQLLSEQARLDEIPLPTSIRVGQMLHRPTLPSEPSNRDFGKVGALAAFLGLSLGTGLALLRDRLARPITSRSDLEAAAGAPLAAMIPPFGSPTRHIADAFRVLAAHVLFARRQSVRTILVTSAQPRDGKTTTAVSLAASLAESGRNVGLVLADLHKPAPVGLLGDDQHWLSDALSGEVEAGAALQPTSVPNLWVIGNALPTQHAGELSNSDSLRHVIRDVEQAMDIVVIDTTPILGPADALTLAPFVDAVLLVAHAQRSTLSRIEECTIELRSVDASILGVVLTGVTARTFPSYHDRATYYEVRSADTNGRPTKSPSGPNESTGRAADVGSEERIGSAEAT